MEHLISACNDFIKGCGLNYAFCGGYALELFTKQKWRTHSDLDITLFHEDRSAVVSYILQKGWDIYRHIQQPANCLKKITGPNDPEIFDCLYLWAVKPGCTLIKFGSSFGAEGLYDFEIADKEQKRFDFIDITFNTRKDDVFICSQEKHVGRKLDKAILFCEDIPYLAPEVILYIIANPAYVESDYHREKNNLDFSSAPPFLPKESMDWLIAAIEAEYSEGNHRLAQLKQLRNAM